MFLCCGRSKEEKEKEHDRPTTATATINEKEEPIIVANAPPPAVVAEIAPPPRVSEEMDYARARRKVEERELERTRSQISGRSLSVREERTTTRMPPPAMLTLGGDRRESSGGGGGGFLGLPSPAISSPASPRLMEEEMNNDEDDWARVVMESVSRAGSTYEGEKSRPVTPAVVVVDPEEKEEVAVPAAKAESLPPQVQEEEMEEEDVEGKEDEKEAPVVDEHNLLYISADAAASFMNYEAVQAPPTPLSSLPPTDDKQDEEPVQEVIEDASELDKQLLRASIDSNQPHTSLYIPAEAAATFINYDAALAPPTPAASISDAGDTPKRGSLITPPPRSPSPAPSFALSERILNDKRASTISVVSTIAAAAASAALDRYALASKRQSMLSTYSYTSYYSRPSSPAPPTNHRLSQLRGSTPTPRSGSPTTTCRFSDASGPSTEVQLLPYMTPLTSQLLPRLDKLLSTTSILSHYSRWESAMSLRREVRAFIASGVDDFLDPAGDIDNAAGLQKAVDAFVARGKGVIDAAADDAEDEAAVGKGMFGDVRAFWAGGRGSGVVAV